MRSQHVNQASAVALFVLALIALGTVVSGYVFPPVPTGDEGTQAHIFQLAVALIAPAGLLFVASADWTQPVPVVRRLAPPFVTVTIAFAALYYLEHVHLRVR